MTAGLSIIDARRAKARDGLLMSGVPNRRIEEWKYTDLRLALGSSGFNSGAPVGLVKVPKGVENYVEEDPAPLWFEANYGNVGPDSFLSDASLASERGVISLRVPADVSIADPISFDWSGFGQIRVLIVLERGASATMIETVAASGALNFGVELVLGEGATLRHVRRSSHHEGAVAMGSIAAKVTEGATYRAHFTTTGAKLSRTELHIALEGEGAQAHLSGVSVLDNVHADVTVHMTHAVGKTQSTQLFKYVAGGHARGVYQGKVTVAEGANGSDSRQTAKGLLLEDRAEIDLKPELEILADDVKCAHGAAVGDLDAESLFYLRSRGLPENEARALLMRAFLGDAVDQIEDEAIRLSVSQAVDAALEKIS